jgi:type II secretory pathway pseudopilin PulG
VLQVPKKKWNLSNAYSLVEVCIVLVILSVLVTITVPSFTTFNNQLVGAEIRKLCSFIRLCSYRAMMTNSPQTIIFDQIHNAYHCGNYREELSHEVTFGAGPRVYGPPSNPTKPISKAITFGKNRLIVYPDGTMQSGALYLTNNNKTITYALTSPVGPVSHIRNYRYDSHSWQLL